MKKMLEWLLVAYFICVDAVTYCVISDLAIGKSLPVWLQMAFASITCGVLASWMIGTLLDMVTERKKRELLLARSRGNRFRKWPARN